MTVPSRTLGDHQAEYVALLGLLAATCKIGREICVDKQNSARSRTVPQARWATAPSQAC
jgi:hypothetical protein